MRTEVETTLLQLVQEIGAGKIDKKTLNAKAFAKRAGLSRQALHKTHAEIVYVLKILSQGLSLAPVPDVLLLERVEDLKKEVHLLNGELKGSVKQCHDLCIEVKELHQQLNARGLYPVHT